MNRKESMNYFYDKDADIFYFSQGTPRANAIVSETGDDMVLRLDSKTKKVRGFTLLNASRRKTSRGAAALPFSLITR